MELLNKLQLRRRFIHTENSELFGDGDGVDRKWNKDKELLELTNEVVKRSCLEGGEAEVKGLFVCVQLKKLTAEEQREAIFFGEFSVCLWLLLSALSLKKIK